MTLFGMCCVFIGFYCVGEPTNVTFSKIKKHNNVAQFCFSRAQDLGLLSILSLISSNKVQRWLILAKILVCPPAVHSILPLDL